MRYRGRQSSRFAELYDAVVEGSQVVYDGAFDKSNVIFVTDKTSEGEVRIGISYKYYNPQQKDWSFSKICPCHMSDIKNIYIWKNPDPKKKDEKADKWIR
jgi:hypothetical protein